MKYELTLIPMKEGQPVIVDGKDYTTAAKSHNVVLNGQRYYVRQNHEGNEVHIRYISSLLESQLEAIEGSLSSELGQIKIIVEKMEED
jgi:hypothetical protein